MGKGSDMVSDTGSELTPVIEITGAVDAVARNLPPELTPDERAAARLRKIDDIAIVLENNSAVLSDKIIARLQPALPPGAKTQLVWSFAAQGPAFSLKLSLDQALNQNSQREVAGALAIAVKQELTSHIAAVANATGIWDAVVTAQPTANQPSKPAATHHVPVAMWRMAAAIAAGVIVVGIYLIATD